jgi:hypothetical protein
LDFAAHARATDLFLKIASPALSTRRALVRTRISPLAA